AVGVVRIRGRRAPQRQQPITDELVQRSPVLEDDLDHLGEVLVQQYGDRLRAQVLGQRGEAADVAEQDRQRAALATYPHLALLVGDLGRHSRSEVALEIRADGRLAPDLLGVAHVTDADGRDTAERRQELEI